MIFKNCILCLEGWCEKNIIYIATRTYQTQKKKRRPYNSGAGIAAHGLFHLEGSQDFIFQKTSLSTEIALGFTFTSITNGREVAYNKHTEVPGVSNLLSIIPHIQSSRLIICPIQMKYLHMEFSIAHPRSRN